MPRTPRTNVAIWTVAPLAIYTEAELRFAWTVHDALDRGTLVLNAPHRA